MHKCILDQEGDELTKICLHFHATSTGSIKVGAVTPACARVCTALPRSFLGSAQSWCCSAWTREAETLGKTLGVVLGSGRAGINMQTRLRARLD